MIWIIDGLSAFLMSLLLTRMILPQILHIAYKHKLFDVPDGRKIHQVAVPRLGGVAFMPAILLSLSIIAGIKLLIFPETSEHYISLFSSNHDVIILCFGLCALLMMYLLGLADDLNGVRYRTKFAVQTAAAILLTAAGARVYSLHGMFGINELDPTASCLLSVLLAVYIMNAFNLTDGIDGLAAGLGWIAMAFYAVTYFAVSQPLLAILAMAGMGVLVPFFYFNVFGNPQKRTKIFMGDTGALTIGLLLSFLSIALTHTPAGSAFNADTLVVAFSPVAIPCLDMFRVFGNRIIHGHSPFLPDRTHIHHKLLGLGLSQPIAMVSIIVMAALLIVLNLWISRHTGTLMVLGCDLALWIILNSALNHTIRRRQLRFGMKCGY